MKRTLLSFALAMTVVSSCLAPAGAYTDFYDISGNRVFTGDSLYEFYAYSSPAGGFQNDYYKAYGNWDRFMRDFGSSLTLYEWINGREYELKLGRFSTLFTPLTLRIERFPWGYPGAYYNSEQAWGKWWDQRNARLRSAKGNDEWTALIAKTAFYHADGLGTDGWLYGGANRDRYFVAMRRKTELAGVQVGFSFVNQHFTNFKTNDTTYPDAFSSQGPFAGMIDDSPPSAIRLRVTDDSPTDEAGAPDYGGAAVFGIRVFINGVEHPALGVAGPTPAGLDVSYTGTYTTAGDRLEANGPNDIITYTFSLPAPLEDIRSVKFLITAANDYRIEASADGANYVPVARAPGNVKDYSNLTALSYQYGEHTGTTLLGIDVQGMLPFVQVPFLAEFSGSRRFYKYLTGGGERTDALDHAWYLKMNREFYPFLLVGEVFDIADGYDAAFAVEDNDDRDDKPDPVDDYVAWYKELAGTRTDDDFVLFRIDRYFREGIDLNNNRAFDAEENDAKPDYPYRAGQRGWGLSAAWRPAQGLKLQANWLDAAEAASDRRNETFLAKTKYQFNTAPAVVELRHEIKRSRDNIMDSLVYDPDNPNPWADQRFENWTDPLLYRDNLVNNMYATFDIRLIPNLTLVNRYLYGIDQRYYSGATHDYQNGVIRACYDNWFPFRDAPGFKSWKITPLYKLERWNEQALEGDVTRKVGDWRKDAFALVLTNRLTEKTSLFVGEQIVLFDDLLQNNDNTRYVFATEMLHNDEYWGRPLLVSAGIKFVNQEAPLEANRQRYEYVYLKTYFVW